MGGNVEHVTDLGLVNYVQHPTNDNYIVFRFAEPKRAETFENRLTEHNIWFEKSEQQGKTRIFYLYGIHRNDYKRVQKINFLVEAEHRSFIIRNGLARWFLILFTTAIVALAFFGYCADQKEKIKILNQYSHFTN